jgi:hypothetical protein
MSFIPSADLTQMIAALASLDSKTRDRLAYAPTATITRAPNTTAYAANDVYGGAFQLVAAGPTDGFIYLRNIAIEFNITALPSGMGDFFLYLYNATPPSAIADNGAFSLPTGDRAACLTPEGLALTTASLARGGGTVVLETAFSPAPLYKLGSTTTSLWAYLVTGSAFTPAANSETATFIAYTQGV